MPARTPEELDAQVAAAFNARDLEAFLELHEDDATVAFAPAGGWRLADPAREHDEPGMTHADGEAACRAWTAAKPGGAPGTQDPGMVARPTIAQSFASEPAASPEDANADQHAQRPAAQRADRRGDRRDRGRIARRLRRPPLHRHAFDVLEGELTFQLRDELFTRGAGELAFAPRDVPHTYANRSGASARALIVCTPAGFERYFARMRAERDGVDPPPWALQDIPATTRVGPRIGEDTDGSG